MHGGNDDSPNQGLYVRHDNVEKHGHGHRDPDCSIPGSLEVLVFSIEQAHALENVSFVR